MDVYVTSLVTSVVYIRDLTWYVSGTVLNYRQGTNCRTVKPPSHCYYT